MRNEWDVYVYVRELAIVSLRMSMSTDFYLYKERQRWKRLKIERKFELGDKYPKQKPEHVDGISIRENHQPPVQHDLRNKTQKRNKYICNPITSFGYSTTALGLPRRHSPSAYIPTSLLAYYIVPDRQLTDYIFSFLSFSHLASLCTHVALSIYTSFIASSRDSVLSVDDYVVRSFTIT
jgi:hypothetical protein